MGEQYFRLSVFSILDCCLEEIFIHFIRPILTTHRKPFVYSPGSLTANF